MASRRQFIIFFGCLTLALTFPACAWWADKPISIATRVWPGYELVYLTRSEGWLDAKRVRLVEMSSTKDTVKARDEEEARLGRLFNTLMVISLGIVSTLSIDFLLLLLMTQTGLYTPLLSFGGAGREFVHTSALLIMLVSTVGLLTYLNMRSLREALRNLRKEITGQRWGATARSRKLKEAGALSMTRRWSMPACGCLRNNALPGLPEG